MEFFKTIRPHLPAVKNYQPGKPLEEVQREYGIKNVIKMASNENALGPSPKAVAAIKNCLKNLHRYPDGGCFYLRNELAKFLNVKPQELVFGNGSDEILVLAVRAFVGHADEVVIAEPTFLIYEIATSAENGRSVKVPMKNFHYDLDAMAAKINVKTKLVFIANPDNPVGTYVDKKSLSTFLAKVPPHVVVVLDEAYFEFAQSNKDYPNGMDFLKKYPNILVTRTFSKAYGLSGLRVGYGVADEKIINALNKIREPFNVNLLAQAGALAALGDKTHLRKTVQTVDAGRKYLQDQFQKMKLPYIRTVTNFILVDVETDAVRIYESLLRKGIIVRGMSGWGLKTFLRVTIGKPEENKRFIAALKEVLAGGGIRL